jgi:hypothetical protein
MEPHSGIIARQPDTADGLAPERLGLDDPAELPMFGAVVPIAFHWLPFLMHSVRLL